MIVVTGASGKLGHHVVDALLERVPASMVVAAVRTPSKAADLAARGVLLRHADYDDPRSLDEALAGAETVLLISANEVGRRAAQHDAVVAATKRAGVKRLAYTSILHANTSSIGLAEEHRATEERIRESGIPHVFLRDGWYIENYTENLGSALAHGGFVGATKNGKISAATREDYARAAAVVLTSDDHENATYELGGKAFTMSDLARVASVWAGRELPYTEVSPAKLLAMLTSAGVPAPMPALLVDWDVAIAHGMLHTDRDDLARLLGREPTTIEQVFAKLPPPHP